MNKKILIHYFIIIVLLICAPIIFLGVMKNNVKAYENKNKEYIYLDPGHGGIDGGGVSNTGVYEKDINLKVCYLLKQYLENCGYNVLLTRYGDYDLASQNSNSRKYEDITKRIQLISEDNVILFVSIHCNIYTSSKIKGAQTFYNLKDEENKKIAESIQEKLVNILKNTTRKAKSINEKYLLDNVNKKGCLVELGFLSNKEELTLLTNKSYQEKIAYAIYLGIIEYLGI